jgi:hypothetical protein
VEETQYGSDRWAGSAHDWRMACKNEAQTIDLVQHGTEQATIAFGLKRLSEECLCHFDPDGFQSGEKSFV